MNRIFRLSLANIRRHKKESLFLMLLILLCMLLTGGSLTAEQKIRQLFPEMMKRTGAWENEITFLENEYDAQFLSYLGEDSRVTAFDVYHAISEDYMKYVKPDGKQQTFLVSFLTADEQKRAGLFEPQSTLSETEIAAMAHPVYFPRCKKNQYQLKEGDTLTLKLGSQQFSFTVAGFYEAPWELATRLVISDADYASMKSQLISKVIIGFNTPEPDDADKIHENFVQKCTETAGRKLESCYVERYIDKRGNFNTDMDFTLKIIEIMAAVIILSVIVMIGSRIISDIGEQIVSIGVLEALGYRSIEISLSYAAEYFLVALAGCIIGSFGSVILYRVLIGISENLQGFSVSAVPDIGRLLLIFGIILLAVTLLAFRKARAVRKIPPVQAFRRGIENHHFGKSHFPLRNTKQNVHLRLALKGFADHAKQNAGLTVVISITTIAVVLSFILSSYFGQGLNVIRTIAGHEISTVQIALMPGVDGPAFAEELASLPEIRKVLCSGSTAHFSVDIPEKHIKAQADVFDDYSLTENIFPMNGRFPEHDNEIMLTKSMSAQTGCKTGDSIVLESNGIQKEYLITGLVTSLMNAEAVYFTADGYQRLCPTYQPNLLEIYAAEGVDHDAVCALLDTRYGKQASDLGSGSSTAGSSYEERIRSRAAEVMSALMQQEDITQMEYSVQAGDTVISGNSSAIRIRSSSTLFDLLQSVMSQLVSMISILTKLFMAIAAIVVALILSILMESEIRRQRKDLGIMKSMGYTSRELMLQLAFRIMPPVCLAVVIGTALSVLLTKLITGLIGAVSLNIPAVLLVDAVILAFCFGCAYFNAGKIKKISVYELMTE